MRRSDCLSYLAAPIFALALHACTGDPQQAVDKPLVAVPPVVTSLPINPDMDAAVTDAAVTDAPDPDDATVPMPDVRQPPPPDAGPPPPPTSAVPAFDSATDDHVHAIVARGLARGNRREVFAKIGDSITESASFLMDCGFGWYDAGGHADLAATIEYFRTVPLEDRNPLNRASLCATAGWTTGDALQGYPDAPLTRELDAIHPMWAIVMYGTNDLQVSDLGTFTANLGMIVDIIEARDVVAVLSTIPPRGDGEPYGSLAVTFSDAIRGIAFSRHLPLIDYYVGMQPLPSLGLGSDGIHPNVYDDPTSNTADTCVFTDGALQFGYNIRNYTALQMLTRLRGY